MDGGWGGATAQGPARPRAVKLEGGGDRAGGHSGAVEVKLEGGGDVGSLGGRRSGKHCSRDEMLWLCWLSVLQCGVLVLRTDWPGGCGKLTHTGAALKVEAAGPMGVDESRRRIGGRASEASALSSADGVGLRLSFAGPSGRGTGSPVSTGRSAQPSLSVFARAWMCVSVCTLRLPVCYPEQAVGDPRLGWPQHGRLELPHALVLQHPRERGRPECRHGAA